MTLTADTTPDAANSTFTAAPLSVVADDSSTSTLTLHIQDVNGNAMTGRADDLTLGVKDSLNATPAAGSVTLSALSETATPGTYTATLKGQRAQAYTVTPALGGSAIGSLTATVTLTAGTTPSGATTGFTATPDSIAADDTATSTLILTLKDTFGNAISGKGSSLALDVKDGDGSAPATGDVTVTQLTEIATPGTYTATLKGKVSGDWTVTPTFGGSAIGEVSATVTLTSGTIPDGTQSAFTVTSPVVANNSDMSTLTFTAKDVNGNAISGIAASLKMSVKDSQNATPAAGKVTVGNVSETATPGVYTAMLKGTLAGVYTVKPLFSNAAIGTLSGTVTLTAGTTPDGVQSTLTASPLSVTANNADVSTLTFTAKDEYGNAIAGLTTLTLAIRDSQSQTPDSAKVVLSTLAETATAGVYTATLKGTLAGVYTVKPLFNAGAIGALSVAVTLTANGTPDGTLSAFAASPKTRVADNIEMSTLTFTAKDVYGNAISGIKDSLKIDIKDAQNATPAAGKITLGTVNETATPGTYTAMLKGTLAGVYTVKPLFNDDPVGTLSDTVTLTAGVPDTDNTSTLVASPVSVVADNTALSTLTLTMKDKYGNSISGLTTLTLEVKDSEGTAPAAGKVTLTGLTETGSSGVYTATLKGTLADTYTVTAKHDGTALGDLSADVTLTAGTTADATKSAFTAAPASVTANNSDSSTLTLTIKDTYGNAMTGRAADLTLTVKDHSGTAPAEGKVTVDTLTETATPGVYTATLKGTLADVYTVTPALSGSAIGSLSATVTLTAGTVPDGVQSAFTAAPLSIVADDSTTSTLTFTAKDAYGNAIAGLSTLTLSVKDSQDATPAEGKVTLTALTETVTPGVYTATLKGQRADTYTVTPLNGGTAVGSLSASVTLTANLTPDGVLSGFTVDPASIVADDVTTSTLTLTAKDKYGNVIPGIATALSMAVKDSQDATPAAGKVTVSAVTESSTVPGTYTATLRGQLTGVYTVTPQNNSAAIGALSGSVTLTAGVPDTGSKTTFTAAPKSVVANNTATSTLTLTAKDRFGNAISGLGSTLTLDVKDSEGVAPADGKVTLSTLTETGSTGVYTATLKGTLAGTYTVTPLHNATAMGSLSDTVTLTADTTPDGTLTTFTANPTSVVADNVQTSTLTLTAKDANGNAIAGRAAHLTLVIKDSQDADPAAGKVTLTALTETATSGTYTATLKGMLADTYTVTPRNDGTAIGTLSADVTLTAGTTPDGSKSAFVANPVSIVADNVETSTLTLTAKDTFGNAITGIADNLTLEMRDGLGEIPGAVVLSQLTESSTTPGTYTATLKGSVTGIYIVKPLDNGTVITGLEATVTLTAGEPDADHSVFMASPDHIVADNAALSTVTFLAKDTFGNLIVGMNKLTLAVKDSQNATPAAGTVTVTTLTESTTTPGTYTGTLKGTLADVYTVAPLNDGTVIAGFSATVTLIPGAADGTQSTLTAAPASIVADDSSTSTLTFVAKDASGNTITGLDKLTLAVKDNKNATPATGKVTTTALTESETTPGTYTATLKGQLADVYTVTVLNDTVAISNLSTTVTLTAGAPDGVTSTLTADPATITADDSTTSTLTFVAKDTFGNGITGLDKLTLGVKDSKGTAPADGKVTTTALTESETTPGTYTATLKGQLADVYTVTVLNDSTAIGTLSTTVTLTAGALDGTTTLFGLAPDTIVANDSDVSTLALVAKDKFGNSIPGLTTLTMVVKDSQNTTPSGTQVNVSAVSESTTTPGTYTATLKGTLAGVYTVAPQLNGSDIRDGSDVPLSKTVTLIAGDVDGTKSTFATSPKSVAADNVATSTLTLTLKDAFGNPVPGMAQSGAIGLQVRGSNNTAPSASKYKLSGWGEDATTPGTYTETISSVLADTLTLKPMISGDVLNDSLSDTVEFVPGVFKDITANSYNFAITAGFPSTGYTDNGSKPKSVSKAAFTLNVPTGKTGADYTWVSDQDWASVSSAGVVAFDSDATSDTKTVKVTATAKSSGLTLQYTFTVSTWYKVRANDGVTWAQGNTYCSSLGMATPSVAQLTSGTNVRKVGSLWAEWGNLITTDMIQSGLAVWYKTTDGPSGNHTIVQALSGTTTNYTDVENAGVGTACFIAL